MGGCIFIYSCYARLISFEINLKTTDFKRNPSGITRIYEYTPPPINALATALVKNTRGDTWAAYGDGYLNRPNNEKNLQYAKEAIQKSVQQVTEAFQFPEKTIQPVEVTKIIPFVDPDALNNTPLFQLNNGKLHQRKDITNLRDNNTSTDWWGLATALQNFRFFKRIAIC